jgi:hypothetical protein
MSAFFLVYTANVQEGTSKYMTMRAFAPRVTQADVTSLLWTSVLHVRPRRGSTLIRQVKVTSTDRILRESESHALRMTNEAGRKPYCSDVSDPEEA